MPRYTQASKERVRDAVDFVELVSARTDLRRAGPSAYEGLCPFHDERTPSFGIDPARKLYYCFGCQAKGDLFTFVQDTENVDFTAALELLADRCGVELEREKEDPREAERRRERERLWELLARTAAFYERCLWESSEAARAREYLLGRGLREESLREFHVGYAPSAWDRVLTASLRSGFSERELYATGLAQRSGAERGRVYDRFRARIMFPLADIRGRVLGFGARALREGQKPKYLNTSDNDVYHKGAHLYGADLARAHAAKAGRTILCEGYTDVIALHQAGINNVVGLMGTALTPEQVGGLARMAPTVLLALDADGAGQEAMLRAATLAAHRKLELRVIPLPQGADPAELVQREGAAAIERALGEAIPLARFRVERILASGDHGSAEGRERMLQQLRTELTSLPQGTMRMELTRVVSERLDLPQSLAERTLAADAGGGAAPPPTAVVERGERTERAFLAQCIAEPQEGAQALAALEPEEHFTNDVLRRAANHLREHLADPGAGLADDDPALAGALAELAVQAAKEKPHPGMLQTQRMQLELARLERRIRAARASGSGEVSALAQRRIEVKREFEQAYERALAETGG